jgi:Mce-associated membrane protein
VNAPQTPKPRRRIAGEVKPADASAPSAPGTSENKPKLSKPKLPKRPNPDPAPSTTSELPAAPPRSDAVRVPRRRPSAVLMTLLILAIASVGFGVYGAWHGVAEWRSGNVAEARAAATDAAASASEEIFSYKYNELDKHMRESQVTMTPKFAKKFRAIAPALNALAPQRKIQVKAVVRYAAAKECGDACSPQKATVLLFVDQARLSADTDKPTVFGNRIEVFMVERNEKWLVDNIKAL